MPSPAEIPRVPARSAIKRAEVRNVIPQAQARSAIPRTEARRDLEWLRRAALLEGATLLALLFLALPLKHGFGLPLATEILGPLHGLAFLGFCWLVVYAVSAGLIGGWQSLRLLLGAVLPFGGFYSHAWLGAHIGARAAASSGDAA